MMHMTIDNIFVTCVLRDENGIGIATNTIVAKLILKQYFYMLIIVCLRVF
ncbi:MAG: hypothetical protein ACI94Y_000494 [Maribacter sp.]|jgi:hypothetical protein